VLGGTVQDAVEVWIIFCCSLPMLLRPHDGHYIAVCLAAVPGVRNGEAVKGCVKGFAWGLSLVLAFVCVMEDPFMLPFPRCLWVNNAGSSMEP
jgi:hypothetical protein